MWTLVFIYLYSSEPFVVKYERYSSMYDCFFAREALGQELSGRSGHFPLGQQAVCVQSKGEEV